MKKEYLNDPKDDLKKRVIRSLMRDPPLLRSIAVLPMFTDVWDEPDLIRYAEAIGVARSALLRTDCFTHHLGNGYGRKGATGYFQTATNCVARDLLADPDNGIPDKDCSANAKHLTVDEITAFLPSCSDRIVLLFHDSPVRKKDQKLFEGMTEHLNQLSSRGLHVLCRFDRAKNLVFVTRPAGRNRLTQIHERLVECADSTEQAEYIWLPDH